MRSLSTLVRAQKRVLDEKRRALNALEAQADEIVAGQTAIVAERDREAARLQRSSDASLGFGYGSYLVGTRVRDAALQQSLDALTPQIEAARDEIADAYAEIKRLELIEAAQIERARKEAAKREQEELDELGLNVFRRNGEAG